LNIIIHHQKLMLCWLVSCFLIYLVVCCTNCLIAAMQQLNLGLKLVAMLDRVGPPQRQKPILLLFPIASLRDFRFIFGFEVIT
jgi:hypothetical protein